MFPFNPTYRILQIVNKKLTNRDIRQILSYDFNSHVKPAEICVVLQTCETTKSLFA